MSSIVVDIPLLSLQISKQNVRKDLSNFEEESETSITNLAEDIQERGLINPITIRNIGQNSYEIVAGQRRFMAFKLLERKTIPCIIKDMNDDDALIISLSENLQRVNMTQKDKCDTFHKLYLLFDKNELKLSKRINLSISQIRKYISIKENVSSEIIELMDKTGDQKITVETALLLSKNVPKEEQLSIVEELNRLGSSKDKNYALQQYKNTGDISLAVSDTLLKLSNASICNGIHSPHILDEKGNVILIEPHLFSEILKLIQDK